MFCDQPEAIVTDESRHEAVTSASEDHLETVAPASEVHSDPLERRVMKQQPAGLTLAVQTGMVEAKLLILP